MITILLEKIITILEGWIQSFTSHAQHVEDKLDSLDQTASDIETNTEPISDIADNTGAVVTPIQNIKSNTDSIKQSSQTSANNTTAILNNISTLSTNTGRAAAFAEDCANNTLDIKDKVTTIASDTTQIRADNANIAADVSSINQALGYYLANTPVTEDVEDNICNFDTDLEDYLQKLKVVIPADLTGFSSIDIIHTGSNIWNEVWEEGIYSNTNGVKGTAPNRIRSKDYIPCRPNTSYFYFYGGSIANLWLRICYYDKNFTFISSDNNKLFNMSYTAPNTAYYLTICCVNANITTYSNDISVNYPSSDTEYHAYNPNSHDITVSFGTTITDGAEINLLDGIIKINSIPVSYQSILPIAVRTYKGVNNIYSDIGTTALTYRETLKHYLDKQDN